MSIGRWLMPRSARMPLTVCRSVMSLPERMSSCQARMSGTVFVFLAFCMNVRIVEMLSEKLGPWIGLFGSIFLISRTVRVQKSSKVPLEASQVLSDSFHGAYATIDE